MACKNPIQAARPLPLHDPLDDDDENGHPQTEETDDPILVTKRRHKKKSADKTKQPEHSDGQNAA